MRVDQAKQRARQWVREAASGFPGFRGAVFHGSTNWLPDDAALPPTSDLDLMIVLDGEPPGKLGKFRYQDIILDVSWLPSKQVHSPAQILGQYELAGSFRGASIIADPTGHLACVQTVVSRDYAKREWVERRCDSARAKVFRYLGAWQAEAPLPDQVTTWLFAAGVTTHMLLVAGLKNPTVRTRYLAVQALLADYGQSAFYEELLDLLGCARMSQARAEQHLTALTAAFDAAKAVIATPFLFAADISDLARPIAIEGSRDLIAQGHQREAVFWLLATYSRCQQVLAQDAPTALRDRFTPGYLDLLADLGITSTADLRQRRDQVEGFLPNVWAVAQAIMDANPEIAA